MPQLATHMLIARRVDQENHLGHHPEALELGAIGPDSTFFLFDAAPAREWLDTSLMLYGRLSRFKGGECQDCCRVSHAA